MSRPLQITAYVVHTCFKSVRYSLAISHMQHVICITPSHTSPWEISRKNMTLDSNFLNEEAPPFTSAANST